MSLHSPEKERSLPGAGSLASGLSALTGALRRFGRFRKRWAILEGTGRFVLVGPGLLLLWLLLDWAVTLPAWPLFLLFVVVCVTGLYAAVRWIVPLLFRRLRPEHEALVIESLHGALDNLLIGALQLGQEALAPAGRPLGYSVALVEGLVARAREEMQLHNPARLLNLRKAHRILSASLAILAAHAALLAFAPDVVGMRLTRLQDSWLAVLDTLFPVRLTVEPGDKAVLRGSPVTLRVHAEGAHRKEILLALKDAETGRENRVSLNLKNSRTAHTVPLVEKSFSYQFVYGRYRSAPKTISAGDRPEIEAISYELAYPAYTGQPTRTLMGRTPKIQVLAGTNVLVSFAATADLHPDLSFVEWREGGRQPIFVNGRFGHFSFAVDRPELALLRLTGRYGRGFEMANPLSLQVAVDKDQAPTVQILARKDKLVLFADEAVALSVPYTAEDDFGVTEVALNYKIDTIDAMLGRAPRQGAVTRLVEPAADRVNGKFAALFKGLDPALQPGDRVRIELAAKDNNTETGPGVGRSRTLEIVIVRPDLGEFAEKQFGFGQTELLGGLRKVPRATNLLVAPERSVRTEKAQKVEKQILDARLNAETWPSGAEDAVGDYFKLLSGGR